MVHYHETVSFISQDGVKQAWVAYGPVLVYTQGLIQHIISGNVDLLSEWINMLKSGLSPGE